MNSGNVLTAAPRPASDTASPNANGEPRKFGTLAGVFTPSLLTIFGVIMFMRAGFVIGQAGIRNALIILAISKLISILTSFSISAIATNTSVKGGGAYYLISRTLGPEFGGTIGIALYCAQALSVPFYILGFTEAFLTTLTPFVPSAPSWFIPVNVVVLVALFVVTYVGAEWAIKAQYVIMGILCVSIVTFLVGSALRFDSLVFEANWSSGYSGEGQNFWTIFAIYFPAVTGIMAGVNMSGNLKKPSFSLPVGTLAAVAVGTVVYAAEIVLVGGAVAREALVEQPFQSLKGTAPMAWMGIFVTFGVFAATLSSGLGSLLGAPRILQALAQDDILRPVRIFAKLSKDGEPRRALWLTFIISAGVLAWVAMSPGGDSFNMIASLVAMLFLCTYGITNLAAFYESFGRNPSFRPRFRLFHWSLALAGAVGAGLAMALINPGAAMGAVALIALLFLYVRKFVLATSFGDARRGFVYARIRENLFRLAQLPVHPKNWRPTSLVLTGNPNSRLTLVKYAQWTSSGRGIVTLVAFILGELDKKFSERERVAVALQEFIDANDLQAFPQAIVARDFDEGLNQLLQYGAALGPLRPNMVVMGFPTDPGRAERFVRHLGIARRLGMSLMVVRDAGLPIVERTRKRKTIDVWWRGLNNGSLMLILAYLVGLNQEWTGSTIRILRIVASENEKMTAEAELKALIEAARMDAKVVVIVADRPLREILLHYSRQSTVILLGFRVPSEEEAQRFQRTYAQLLDGLPTTLLVHSIGEADLTS